MLFRGPKILNMGPKDRKLPYGQFSKLGPYYIKGLNRDPHLENYPYLSTKSAGPPVLCHGTPQLFLTAPIGCTYAWAPAGWFRLSCQPRS